MEANIPQRLSPARTGIRSRMKAMSSFRRRRPLSVGVPVMPMNVSWAAAMAAVTSSGVMVI